VSGADGRYERGPGVSGRFAMDRLADSVRARGNVCVGLDTAFEYIPPAAAAAFESQAGAVLAFNREVIESTLDVAACYKVQIAYYEALGLRGMEVYAKTLAFLRERGAVVIADIKRGDIADTALRYARAHFSGDFEADLVTLNPYMGMDSLAPWLEEAGKHGKGAFVLLKTSNPGYRDFQGAVLKDGRLFYESVKDKLALLAEKEKGESGYGIFGAVFGIDGTFGSGGASLSLPPGLFLLIPGYGAQGAGPAEVSGVMNGSKSNAVVNASRLLLKAWTKEEPEVRERATIKSAALSARRAAINMRDEILRYGRAA